MLFAMNRYSAAHKELFAMSRSLQPDCWPLKRRRPAFDIKAEGRTEGRNEKFDKSMHIDSSIFWSANFAIEEAKIKE
jgi:hypothetical protein